MLSSHLLKLSIHLSDFDQNHVEQSSGYEIADGNGATHYDVIMSYGFRIGYSSAEKVIEGQDDGSNYDLTPVANSDTEVYYQTRYCLVCARLIIVFLIYMEALDKVKEIRH